MPRYSATEDVVDNLKGAVVDVSLARMACSLARTTKDSVDRQAVFRTVLLEAIADVWCVVYVKSSSRSEVGSLTVPKESCTLSPIVMAPGSGEVERHR